MKIIISGNASEMNLEINNICFVGTKCNGCEQDSNDCENYDCQCVSYVCNCERYDGCTCFEYSEDCLMGA